MKTEKLIFLIFVCFGLLFGCTQYEIPGDDLSGIDLKNASAPAVFIVNPSGDDDTPAISQAFEDAKAAGPGSVVQLIAGEYHLGLLEVRDFYGIFKGAGKDKTIITAMNNLDAKILWDQNLRADLVKFVGGDVRLCQFTLQTPPGRLSVTGPPAGNVRSLIHFSANNAVYEAGNENRSINVVIDEVSFKGQILKGGPGYNMGYNSWIAIGTGWDVRTGSNIPRGKIDFMITNSEFDTFCYGLGLEGMKNGKIIIGEKNNGNVFSNLDQAGGVWESRNMEVLVEGNTFNIPAFSTGLDLDDYRYYPFLKAEPQEKAMLFDIRDNIFNLVHAEYALLLRNTRRISFPEEPASLFQVRNNQFNMTDGYEWAIACFRTRGTVIRNNKFSGYGDLGLYIATYSEYGLVLGNNFSSAEFYTGAAFLAANTNNWTFVGGNIGEKVIDNGINNVITGVNVSTSETPLGRSISEKIVPMNHLMH